MSLMTYKDAQKMYQDKIEEEIERLIELRAADCPRVGEIHLQEKIARRAIKVFERCKEIADKVSNS